MTIARIERALVAAAYIVATHGPEYAWLMRRLEEALEEAKRDDPVARAKAILEAYGQKSPIVEFLPAPPISY